MLPRSISYAVARLPIGHRKPQQHPLRHRLELRACRYRRPLPHRLLPSTPTNPRSRSKPSPMRRLTTTTHSIRFRELLTDNGSSPISLVISWEAVADPTGASLHSFPTRCSPMATRNASSKQPRNNGLIAMSIDSEQHPQASLLASRLRLAPTPCLSRSRLSDRRGQLFQFQEPAESF
jgi:hypothetical protein